MALLLSSCAVGPDYRHPTTPVPQVYKELPPDWKIASPSDEVDRGAWWSIYRDPPLDGLERQIAISNQNLKASEATHDQAVALVQEARSRLFPVVSLPNSTRGSATSGTERLHENGMTATRNTLGALLEWELDIWGKVRRQIESQHALAQASAADLAALRLSTQAELATDYFELRFADSLSQLLGEEVSVLERSLRIVENQYRFGAVPSSDMAAAEAQLQTVRAQLIATGVGRAQYEHAIALLAGQAPADLTIAAGTLADTVPEVPLVLPSHLLERRPDIAAAERRMASQNAQIGMAIAAYYPDISLGAGFGYNGKGAFFRSTNQVWGAAATATGTLLDAGGRSGSVAAARAAYRQSEAQYRQTVLSAFEQVEDALSDLRIQSAQASAQDAAVMAAHRSDNAALLAYQAGAQPYTAVVSAQLTVLSNRQAALQVRLSRLLSTVALFKALGGGWQTSDLDR